MAIYQYLLVDITPNISLIEFLDFHGQYGREIVQIYNNYAIFKTGSPFPYVHMLQSNTNDMEGLLNSVGVEGWKFVMLYNDYVLFKLLDTSRASAQP